MQHSYTTQGRPLGKRDDNSLQRFIDVVVKLFVVAQLLIPRPHKVTICEVQDLSHTVHQLEHH